MFQSLTRITKQITNVKIILGHLLTRVYLILKVKKVYNCLFRWTVVYGTELYG